MMMNGMGELQLEMPMEDSIYNELIKTNLADRRIVFNKEVDSSLIEDVVLYILKWNQEDKGKSPEARKPIYIYLNTNGGDVVSGMNLISVLASTKGKTPVYGVVMACAASMGAYLAMAFHKTYAFSNSVLLLHDGSTGTQGSSRKAKDQMNFYDELDNRVKKFVLDNTNITEEFYEEIADREYYMFADEAKELGIVDYIIGEDVDLDEIL